MERGPELRPLVLRTKYFGELVPQCLQAECQFAVKNREHHALELKFQFRGAARAGLLWLPPIEIL